MQVGKVFLKAFKYVGNISQDSNKVTLDSIDYINSIEPMPISCGQHMQNHETFNDSESTS